ncbi:thiamine phosphate synthase [Rhodophyticola porphyridii]|uniref:Thiamine-phosphate synthase n=1 Tax=Rhodophyticola porphyridii TaxID=1852017 RepID=A0A3L9Y1J6_9RHOB|nr:thiamine phosphate synthase [Rhodophyticola porphyridii]RMA42332.1 thiamine phosphate synthase [Rhodophyticola porphyridii]
MTRFDLSLYLVLDPTLCGPRGMVETAQAAVAGGATMVQLRHKTASTAERTALGRALKSALAGTGAALIVNDDIEAARACDADGLHVGQDDMPVADARARIGPDLILGLSVETVDAARAADPALVTYVGAGPVFATATKPDHKPPIGFDGLARLVAAAPVPTVAIGGLNGRHAAGITAAGAAGMAVVSAICGTRDPGKAAHSIALALKEAHQ